MFTKNHIKFIFTISLLFLETGLCQSIDVQGQLATWFTTNPEKSFDTQLGIRYIPALSVEKYISDDYLIDAELSINTYGSVLFQSSEKPEDNGRLKPYRMWLRFSSSQFEMRLGLQKINFGSASILRPLMWFDRIDPRDPLQMTDGVYGLLARYYFLDNTNIWAWGLYGNDETKGWEIIPTKKQNIEFGGRLQIPLFEGEIGATYHYREADISKSDIMNALNSGKNIPENRFGLDGKWDIGIGTWFEGVIIERNINIDLLKYQKLINIGIDYTFDIGNGLNAVGEYFRIETSEKITESGVGASFSAVSFNYPFGLIDNLSAIVYYDWDNDDLYRFLNWQWTYDNYSLNFIGFWNPDKFQIYQNQEERNLFTGKGIQVLFVLNH